MVVFNEREKCCDHNTHHNDAGFDLSTKMPVIIYPGEVIYVPTGYYPDEADIPDGAVGLVFARSS